MYILRKMGSCTSGCIVGIRFHCFNNLDTADVEDNCYSEMEDVVTDIEEQSQRSNIEAILSTVDSFVLRIDEYDLDVTEAYLTDIIMELDKTGPCSSSIRKQRKAAIQSIQSHLRRIDQQRRIDGHPVYEDNTSDSASNSDSSKELTSDDSDAEDWEAMDRTQFISDLLGRDKEKREQIANLSLADNSQQGKLFNLVTWMFYFIYTWKCINVISDNALNTLLSFLYHIFQLMSIQDKFIAAALHLFPASIYALRRMFNVDRDDFERMIVCPKCTAVYKHTECFPIDSTVPHMLHCESVVNKTKKRTTRCKHSLFKKVLLKGGVEAYYPLKTYCYKPIIDSMELLLSRPGFAEICDHWKTRDILPGRLCDIYDGDVWQSFQTVGGHSFLSNPFSYGLQLNVDWFQPFTRRKDVSVGVIYIALLNLPLHLRFKRENIMIAGIIPNLDKEPSLHNFLEPLVAELQHLWKGVRMNVEARTTTKDVRAALLCCAADIPAARKLCGFLGHAATLGCSKCLKRFPGGFGVKKNYSGFNRENWPMRMYRDHLKTIKMLEKCKSKTSKRKMESQSGWRYSPLTKLDYFNSVLHHVVDPMHNLFLGTAKKMFKMWIENDILTKEKLRLIDEKIASFKMNSDFGRLPKHIAANWGGFTAEQWKTWTLVYSIYVLEGIIPKEHLTCWHTFVTACRKIVSPVVAVTDARIADLLFVKFGKEVQRLYGEHSISPNMHMHCHIYASIKGYGSMYAFWLFSFERFNGMLEKYHTNMKENFEIQLMREFLTTNELISRNCCAQLDENSSVLLPLVRNMTHVQPLTTRAADASVSEWKLTTFPLTEIYNWCELSSIDCHKQQKQISLDSDELNLLQCVYQTLYKHSQIENMAITIHKFSSVHINGKFYSSKAANRENFARIMAYWIKEDGQIDEYSGKLSPGSLKFFFSHTVDIDSVRKRHYFACVDWHKPYLDGTQYCQPVSSWYRLRYYRGTSASFMPVQRIHSRFAGVELKDDVSEILVACPLYKQIRP